MAKKEQFTKEEHRRAERQADEIAYIIKSSKELMRTFESLISPSELRYYQLLGQYIQDKNNTVLNDEKKPKMVSETTFNKEENLSSEKPKKLKGKGGRTIDLKIAKMRNKLNHDYYNLTVKKGYKKSKAIQMLEKQYPWKKSTIVQYLK